MDIISTKTSKLKYKAQQAAIKLSQKLAQAGTPRLFILAKNLNINPSLAIAYAILGMGNIDPNIEANKAATAPAETKYCTTGYPICPHIWTKPALSSKCGSD